jgi:thiamine monophosphate kinase
MFTAPESSDANALGTKIGEITEGSIVRVFDKAGKAIELDQTGFRHFS